MRGTSGLVLIGVGILHAVLGVFKGYSLLSEIARSAFATETGRRLVTGLGKEFVFWFLFGGFLMLVLGHFFTWVERRLNHAVPSFIGWELVLLSVLGLSFMPLSGFWLVLGVAIYTIVAARHSRQAAGAVT